MSPKDKATQLLICEPLSPAIQIQIQKEGEKLNPNWKGRGGVRQAVNCDLFLLQSSPTDMSDWSKQPCHSRSRYLAL